MNIIRRLITLRAGISLSGNVKINLAPVVVYRRGKSRGIEVGAGFGIRTGHLLPVILKAKEAGEDMETAAWKWFFQWIETWLGRGRFKRLVDDYFSEQTGSSGSATKEMSG